MLFGFQRPVVSVLRPSKLPFQEGLAFYHNLFTPVKTKMNNRQNKIATLFVILKKPHKIHVFPTHELS